YYDTYNKEVKSYVSFYSPHTSPLPFIKINGNEMNDIYLEDVLYGEMKISNSVKTLSFEITDGIKKTTGIIDIPDTITNFIINGHQVSVYNDYSENPLILENISKIEASWEGVADYNSVQFDFTGITHSGHYEYYEIYDSILFNNEVILGFNKFDSLANFKSLYGNLYIKSCNGNKSTPGEKAYFTGEYGDGFVICENSGNYVEMEINLAKKSMIIQHAKKETTNRQDRIQKCKEIFFELER
ncbi:MAG: hypothetical protein ACOCUL_02955, partial [Bacteroidota bacterium]